MKNFILKTTLLFISLTTFGQTATYDIVFTSNWEAHGTLPGNAHFTALVGATHNSDITFLEMDGMATSGIELVAELGSNGTFNSEVNNAIANNDADQYIAGPNLYPTSTNKTITINDLIVSSDYPLISLVSMIAPSPDWMIAVNSISLVDTNGDWIPEITLDLYAYDAGTEEGTGYSLNNAATNPQEAISSLQGIAPFTSEKIGTIVFSQNVLSIQDFNPQEKEQITIAPNPSNGNISILSGKSNSIQEIEVYNVLGTQVRRYNFKQSNATINLDLSNLNAGVYLVRLHNDSGVTETQKLILR